MPSDVVSSKLPFSQSLPSVTPRALTVSLPSTLWFAPIVLGMSRVAEKFSVSSVTVPFTPVNGTEERLVTLTVSSLLSPDSMSNFI